MVIAKRRRGYALLTLLACALALTGTVAAQEIRETFPQKATLGLDPVDYYLEQQSLHTWLLSEQPAGVFADTIRVPVTPADMAEVDRADAADPGRTVVGLTKPVGRQVDFTTVHPAPGAQRPFAGGVLQSTEDGGFVWAVALRSEGAAGLRVGFSDGRLPDGAQIYVYNQEGQAFGPYTRDDFDEDGDLWSNTVRGPEVIVQVRVWGPARPSDLRGTGFAIQEIGHIGPRFTPFATQESFCSYNETCIENAECSGGPSWSAKSDAQDATGLMLWISGAFINTCTGGLLNDTAGSQTPYFLTANHCISRNKDAKSLETFFQYTVSCGGGCPPAWQGGGIQTSPTGAAILSTSSTSDYTLFQLNGNPPAGSVFMGWTTAPVANSNGTDLYRISHPATAPQAYSAQSVDTSAGTCQGIPRGAWIYSRDTYGATEGGSSGSPVYNGAGQVVGQLTGSCGTNNLPCDSVNNATIDGAFANYYNAVAQYLDPSPCVPSAEICDDGQDNDCDGATDCNDSDCSGDPACSTGGCVNPGGAPSGASCDVNSDCCSDNCKGKPGSKTCK